jgi:lysophospholipase L1-like esterase
VSQLRSSFQVSWKLSAQTGYQLSDVVDILEAAPTEYFDAALIAVGVNDVTGRTNLKSWKAQHGRLIHLLTAKFAVRHVLLTSLPPMHSFPALPQPLRWYLGARANRLNSIVQKIASADSRCELLQMNFPFEAGCMAADGFHPGPLAYALWGQHAAGAIRRRIQN